MGAGSGDGKHRIIALGRARIYVLYSYMYVYFGLKTTTNDVESSTNRSIANSDGDGVSDDSSHFLFRLHVYNG